MKRFLLLQLWLGLLIVGVFVYYGEKDSKKKVPASLVRWAEKQEGLQELLLLDSVSFAGHALPLSRIDFQEILIEVLGADFFARQEKRPEVYQSLLWLPILQKTLDSEQLPNDLAYCALPLEAKNGFWALTEGTARTEGLRVEAHWDERYHPIRSTQAMISHLKKSRKGAESWLNTLMAHRCGSFDSLMDAQEEAIFYNVYAETEGEKARMDNCLSLLLRAVVLKRLRDSLQTLHVGVISKHRRYSQKAIQRRFPVRTPELCVDTLTAPYDLRAYVQKRGYKILRLYNPWWRVPHVSLRAHQDEHWPDVLFFCRPAALAEDS